MTNFCKDCLWHRNRAFDKADICTHPTNDPEGFRVRGEGSSICLSARGLLGGCGPDGLYFELRPESGPQPTVVDTRSVWQTLRDLWRS
jgi:hypothetical protein